MQDFVLPAASQGRGHWLGYVPHDVFEIGLAVDARSGFVLERVGLRRNASLFAECLLKQPIRVGPALYHFARNDERRFRDILRGSCAVTPLARYGDWALDRAFGGLEACGPHNTTIGLILPAHMNEAADVAATAASVRSQTYPSWTLTIAWFGADRVPEPGSVPPDPRITHRLWPTAGRLHDLAENVDALAILHPGDCLTSDALAQFESLLGDSPAPEMIYADEMTAEGRPRLKPDWSPDLALVQGYLGSPTLYAGDCARRLGDRPLGALEHLGRRVMLAAMDGIAPDRVVHLPRVLCRTRPPSPEQAEVRSQVLERHLTEIGSSARIDIRDGVLDLLWPLSDPPPRVTIVIPSRDRLELIATATRGVLHETAYPEIELVIVDNASTDPAVLAHYEGLRTDPRVRIEPWPHAFNFSAMVNAGVSVAQGEVIVLLNNDVAVLDPGWLEAMVRQACRPEIGAVGAKLLYADGRLQHAGVVVGLGGRAGHILRRRRGDAPGHLGQMRVAHEVSAVTAACLAVRKSTYERVGGFDAEAFPVDFNDVDFCLRLDAAGYRTIWTPKAVLSHFESVTRGPPVGEARRRFEREGDRFAERWRDTVRHDPFYHPALSLTTFGEDLE